MGAYATSAGMFCGAAGFFSLGSWGVGLTAVGLTKLSMGMTAACVMVSWACHTANTVGFFFSRSWTWTNFWLGSHETKDLFYQVFSSVMGNVPAMLPEDPWVSVAQRNEGVRESNHTECACRFSRMCPDTLRYWVKGAAALVGTPFRFSRKTLLL